MRTGPASRGAHRRLLAAGACLALAAAPVAAETLKVPQQYATIQEAVDDASNGDVIVVKKGDYAENVVVTTSGLTLQGKGAVIDGGLTAPCVQVTADGFAIRGFTLVNGVVGVQVTGDGAVLEQLVVEGSSNDGVDLVGDDATVSKCRFVRVESAPVDVTASPASVTTVDRCRFEGEASNGYINIDGGRVVIERNRFVLGFAGLLITTDHADGESVLSRNVFQRCDGDAFQVTNAGAGTVLLERNRLQGVTANGFELTGDGFTARRNTLVDVLGVGFQVIGDTNVLERNTVQPGAREGFLVTGDDNVVEKNTVRGAFDDGCEVTGSRNMLLSNKFSGCYGDGIDIQNNGTLDASVDNELVGNLCVQNGHEGIDNTGTDSRIDGNKCSKNGGDLGPDIAGAGDDVTGGPEGDGTLASFTTNNFKTGGETTDARHDR